MNKEQRERTARILREELETPSHWIYLSFADDVGFRGAAIVYEHGIVSAVMSCHARGINPGGGVLGHDLTEEQAASLPYEATNRLLTKADLEKLFGPLESMGEARFDTAYREFGRLEMVDDDPARCNTVADLVFIAQFEIDLVEAGESEVNVRPHRRFVKKWGR